MIKKYEENKALKTNILSKLKNLQLDVEKSSYVIVSQYCNSNGRTENLRNSKRLSIQNLTMSLTKSLTPTKTDKYSLFIYKYLKYTDCKNPVCTCLQKLMFLDTIGNGYKMGSRF